MSEHMRWVTGSSVAYGLAHMNSQSAVAELMDRLDALSVPSIQGVIRLSVPCRVDSLMGWLDAQTVFPRGYWKARDAGAPEYATLGMVSVTDSLETLQADLAKLATLPGEQPDYFGGMAFDATSPGWENFKNCCFILPRVELKRSQQGALLTLNLRFDDRCGDLEIAEARVFLASLQQEQPLPPLRPHAYLRYDSPAQQAWSAWVSQVAHADQLCHTPKVVLSRETRLVIADDASKTPSPWALLGCWQAEAAACFQLGIQWDSETAFIGCPPERLYQREGTQLVTEALAGTTHRGADARKDQYLAEALLVDTKNSLENQCVYEDILTRLEPLSRDVQAGETHVLKLRSVQHIRRLIHAELHHTVTDQALLASLPPTPAVGGVPRASALAFIRQHEHHQRGWYAGVFGRVSLASTELAVAIRCAHIGANEIRLYAGAGIVAGSQPDAEWRELDNKIADIMSLLNMG
ncbi:isochorismate synthase [Halomonas sp.]|uniref:isochorismate synthase n=1 Tax=Halomonas sp. TaxID=1486246 RepID=UPI003F92E8C5